MATSNEKLSDSFVQHQTFLLRYARGLRNRMMTIINKSSIEIEDIARSRLMDIKSIEKSSDWNKVQRALKRIETIRNAAWTEAQALALTELRTLARSEPAFTIQRIQAVLPVQVALEAPTAAQVDTLRRRPVQGRTPNGWMSSLKNADQRVIKTAVTQATTEGSALMSGLKGAFKQTSNNVFAASKTLVVDTAQKARQATLETNDVVQQEEFISVLDSRTTLICASNDGKLYAVGRGPKPPLHVGCRSIRVAVLARDMLKDMPLKPETEKELVQDYAKRNNLGNITSRSELPYGYKGDFDKWAPQRVSGMIGGPAQTVSYSEWLKRQPASFQVDTLGPTRAALFRKGGVSLDKFVDGTGDALTLDQLAQRVPGAFKKI